MDEKENMKDFETLKKYGSELEKHFETVEVTEKNKALVEFMKKVSRVMSAIVRLQEKMSYLTEPLKGEEKKEFKEAIYSGLASWVFPGIKVKLPSF